MQSNEEITKALGKSKPSNQDDVDKLVQERREQLASRLASMENTQNIVMAMGNTLSMMRKQKPNDRGERDRYWAIAITDLEKVVAIFKTYCT